MNRLIDKDATFRQAYKRKFCFEPARWDEFVAQCHGFTEAKISAAVISDIALPNSIRPGSLKRQLDFVILRDLKARLGNDPELLQSTIDDGPVFQDQDTGDDMYPVLKQKDTPSYIYRLPSREVSPVGPCHSPSEV